MDFLGYFAMTYVFFHVAVCLCSPLGVAQVTERFLEDLRLVFWLSWYISLWFFSISSNDVPISCARLSGPALLMAWNVTDVRMTGDRIAQVGGWLWASGPIPGASSYVGTGSAMAVRGRAFLTAGISIIGIVEVSPVSLPVVLGLRPRLAESGLLRTVAADRRSRHSARQHSCPRFANVALSLDRGMFDAVSYVEFGFGQVCTITAQLVFIH